MKPTFLQRLFSKRMRRLCVSCRMEGVPRAIQHVRVCGSGKVSFGREVLVGWKQSPMFHTTEAYFEAREKDSEINVGDSCIFNNGAAIIATKRISIGKRSIFGTGFRCYDSDFHGLLIKDRHNPSAFMSAPVSIGEDCWCGDGVTILKGVTLGKGCVVGAGSVVTRSFDANSVIAGNPARLIKVIDQ